MSCFSRHSCPKHWPWSHKIFAYKTVRTKDWIIKGNGFRLTRRVPLVEQELPILPEHLSSPPVFNGVHVTRSLILFVCFVDRCLSLCTFSFGHCVVCPSSIYGFWLPLWYLLAIVLSVLPRYTDSDYPFGIFKLFL
jgi:hypothetical protein